MSSRISDFGTLAERVMATAKKPEERVVDPAQHVWVATGTGHQAGLLVGWERGSDGSWWGNVALADAPGEASLQKIHARLLTPTREQPPPPPPAAAG